MQENPRNIGEDLAKVQGLAGAVLFPVTFGISAVAPAVVHLLYGSKWAGLGTVISILVIMPGMGLVWSLNETAYQAIGRPDLWSKVLGLSLLVMLPVLWLMGPRGLVAFTLGRFSAGWILPLGNIYLSARILRIGIRGQLKAIGPPLMISLGMCVLVALLVRQGSPFEGISGWIKLLAIIVIGATTYLVLVRTLLKELWDQMFMNLRRIFS
jgi:O-antigen/teichoic acid export membrane protein